jgi:pimeloyl-ACP methyl ester carboxylesterase
VVVLIHGIPTGPALWRHVVPRLSGVRTLVVEMVGYAQSIPEGHERDLSVAAQAGYLDALLDHLGVDRAVLAGHDLGGGVAQIVAARRPERLAGLMLTNTISYDSWPIPSVAAMRRAAGLVARTPDAVLAPMLRTLVQRGHDDAHEAERSFDTHWSHYARHGAGPALARQAAPLDASDTLAVADALPRLRVPTRIVWGVADPFQKPVYAERLARDLGTRPIAIRGGKHFTPEDHPGVVADAILDVVRSSTV